MILFILNENSWFEDILTQPGWWAPFIIPKLHCQVEKSVMIDIAPKLAFLLYVHSNVHRAQFLDDMHL